MLRFVILVLTLVAITSAQDRKQRSFNRYEYSAASESQIKNAIENNYDDTGPGAKGPEQAFKTFNTLEDALINYLDDPDTKLPEHERAKAIQRLVRPEHFNLEPINYVPKVNKWKPIQAEPISILNKFGLNNRELYNQYLPYRTDLDYRAIDEKNLAQYQSVGQNYPRPSGEAYKLQTIQAVKSNPVSLAHYTRAQDEGDSEFNPNPQYSFSYGVHDKHTGDSKSAHETRDGGVVRGFYSFMDADGKQRTVRYTADDKQGFRATVQRHSTQ
ncbi:uncharacterized protein [Epargyreus clarus]|uniref:uncharacterized protein n=1 Tax=Epargyreus clarus TaxID=520877 RepID=UPI003C2E4743